MLAFATWVASIIFSPAPIPGRDVGRPIHVNCRSDHALQRALDRSNQGGEVEIYLHGTCTGNFVITSEGVTLRGATPESGLAARAGNPSFEPVLEVVDVRVSLRGLVVRGAETGIHVHGWDAELFLSEVDVRGQDGFGVFAERGARAQLLDTTLRDGGVGILVTANSTASLQHVTVTNNQIGVYVTDRSFAAINDTTIEDSHEGGLNVTERSDANVLGGVFRENGQVHMGAGDWSRITLLNDPVIGSPTDTTEYALSVTRYAAIASYGTSEIYGHASALIGGALQLGNTVLHGDLIARQFANAHVRNAEITGSVLCFDGAEVICSGATSAGSAGCPSSSCGPATAEAIDRARSAPTGPALPEPDLEIRPRPRSRP